MPSQILATSVPLAKLPPSLCLGFRHQTRRQGPTATLRHCSDDGEVSEAEQGGGAAAGGATPVIVRPFHEGMRDKLYGHCLVAGIKKYPTKVIRKDSLKKTAKKSRVKAFVKLVNYTHIMPTRYTLDFDLKDVVTVGTLQSKDKNVTALKETKKRFEERFKTGKNRWFFTKLRF